MELDKDIEEFYINEISELECMPAKFKIIEDPIIEDPVIKDKGTLEMKLGIKLEQLNIKKIGFYITGVLPEHDGQIFAYMHRKNCITSLINYSQIIPTLMQRLYNITDHIPLLVISIDNLLITSLRSFYSTFSYALPMNLKNLFLINHKIYQHRNNYIQNLLSFLKINIQQENAFDKEKGYTFYYPNDDRKVPVLLYRYDKINHFQDDIQSKYSLNLFSIINEDPKFSEFNEKLNLSDEILSEYFENDFTRYFYTNDEINEFKSYYK